MIFSYLSLMKKKIHVNQNNLKSNKFKGTKLPPIVVKTYKETTHAFELIIMGQDDKEAARLVYKPSAKGPSLWIETDNRVVPITEFNNLNNA